jgi:hypothetical protein
MGREDLAQQLMSLSVSFPFSIAIGDFNTDGKQDFVVANNFSAIYLYAAGDGSGGFTSGFNVGAGSSPISVAVGDFNNDGKQDLAVSNYDTATVTIRTGMEPPDSLARLVSAWAPSLIQ